MRELRTYIFSGVQFWKLVSGRPVDDPEQAGLFEAKRMMAESRRRDERLSILAKLQRHRGYRGWRIRPYPLNTTLWLAETYIWLGRGNKKGWRSLWDEKRDTYQTFRTPEEAYEALLAMEKEYEQE